MTAIQTTIATAAKEQVAWSKKSIYEWEQKPTITKSEKKGTCVTYVACVLQRIGVLSPGGYVWTNGTGYGDGKVIGTNSRMTVTYYRNKKTVKDILKSLQPGDILIFNDNKSGKVGSCGHICIYNGKTYSNGIHTFTGGHIISVNGKEKYSRVVFAVIRINTMPKRKTVNELAIEVLDGTWGSGDKRKENLINHGYDYYAVQDRVNELLALRHKATAWAEAIAKDNRYHYNLWKQDDPQSHKCPICSGLDYNKDKAHYGWNCIGFTAATWHHGMGLNSVCKCGWVSAPNGTAENLLTKTDEEALTLARKYIGVKDIQLIRNKNGIPQAEWREGDICFRYHGNTCDHLFYYAGNNTIIDSCGSDGKMPNDLQISPRSAKGYTAKVIIRYIGNNPAKYSGKLPSLKIKKTNEEVIADTVKWACWIAGDNDFHYGYGKEAHHNGCYFCGTEDRLKKGKGIKNYEHTYCCNPFVGAAWAHGGCVPKALELCQNCNSWDFGKGKGYDKSSLFDNLGHPDKSKLKAGDVLCSDTHVALYIGGGKIAEASGGDDNVKGSKKWNNSIHIADLTDAKYKKFKRVHRFNSSVNATCFIYHGEISKRVYLLQEYLNWYSDGKFFEECGPADGIYGDNTFKWCCRFQEEQIGKGEGDGIVGPKTIAAMEKVVK